MNNIEKKKNKKIGRYYTQINTMYLYTFFFFISKVAFTSAKYDAHELFHTL